MKLRTAELVPDTAKECGTGTRNAHIGIVRIEGELHRAYLKPLSPDQVAAECFAALLLRAWGLFVPEPLIVSVGADAWFGSLAVGYPDLAKRFAIAPVRDPAMMHRYALAIRVVTGFNETPLALACDEAIANGDRNLQNILWDGGAPAWIDHERSLGMPDSTDQNLLALFAIGSGDHGQVQQRAVAAALTFAQDAIDAVATAMPEAQAFVMFVKQRIVDVPGRVLKRFPQPHDLLQGG